MIRALTAAAALSVAVAGACLAQGASTPTTGSIAGSAAPAKAGIEGWRARQLLGSSVLASGQEGAIGQVRDIIVDADGRIEALIVEGGGPLQLPEAVYRVPWREVDLTPGKVGVSVDLSDAKRPRYGLFPGSEGVATLPREFRVTEVIGDYARLQTGHGYGYVTDVVFTSEGRLGAVLVTRSTASGAATAAFPFPGVQSRWDPGATYFGLPHVTVEQADKASIPVDPSRLSQASL